MSISCKKCPFHDTGLCNDVWGHAKEFIELFKPSITITGTMRRPTWEDFASFCEKAENQGGSMKTVEQIAKEVQEMLQTEKEELIQNILYDQEQLVLHRFENLENAQKQLAETTNKRKEMLDTKDPDEFIKKFNT